MNDLAKKIDELVDIKEQQTKLKERQTVIEAELIMKGSKDLENTKYKSIRYCGEKSTLTVTNAQSVKIVYTSFLSMIFGRAYKDFVKEETTYKLTTAGVRMIQGLWKKEFVGVSVADVITQMVGVSEEERKQLLKKCKGKNYSGDVENILKFTNLEYQDACEYAFMITEAACWQEFCGLLQLNSINPNDETAVNDLLNKIQSAFIVEDITKISVSEVI